MSKSNCSRCGKPTECYRESLQYMTGTNERMMSPMCSACNKKLGPPLSNTELGKIVRESIFSKCSSCNGTGK